MKKHLLTILAVLLCGLTASAQTDVTAKYITNPSFEGGTYNCDNGTGHGNLLSPEGWTVTYTNADWGWKNFQPVADGKGQSGSKYFEFWGDIYHTLDLSQKVYSLPAGAYILTAAMRTERADQVTNQHIYVKAGNSTYGSATLGTPIGSAWNAVDAWQTLTVEFTLDQASDVVIGATSTGEASSKGWFQIDNFRLHEKQWEFNEATGHLYVNYDYFHFNPEAYPWHSVREQIKSVEIGPNVTSIGERAFHSCSSLTSINIPEGVTSIGELAFQDCSSLTSINIPSSVTSIGEQAFCDCSSLTSINIPSSVASIGSYAFRNCSSLTSINIPEGVTSIGSYAFYNCSSLTSINIPSSVTSIGEQAFCDCSSLTSITIPDGVTCIEDLTFQGCSSLTSITIPEGVTSIGGWAFQGCSSLTSITIPEGVTSIGVSVFSDCSSLTSITIPDGVTCIEDMAFYGCSSLTSITIPSSVTSIGLSVFSGCEKLNTVINLSNLDLVAGSPDHGFVAYYADKVWTPGVHFDNLPERALSIGDKYPISYTVIPEGLEVIWSSEDESVATIDQNGVITAVGDGATGIFASTNRSTSSTVVFVQGWEFNEATGHLYVNYDYLYLNPEAYPWHSVREQIKSVEIGPNVTSIGEAAFHSCSSLTSITIPDGVTCIENLTFYGCSSLTSINIPEGVTSIGEWAFLNCSSLTSINIPEGVTSIGVCAFQGCSSLTSITIPEGVTSIGEQAFSDCSSLTSITIPDGVTCIGRWAFNGCSSLTSITIPDGVASIGERAFQNCSSLTSITIPDGVTSIGSYAFSGCSSLTSINIPEGVTSIGVCAFENCSSLTSITIPSSVASIGERAFQNCSSLTSITIPDGVTSIGSHAFSGCSSLTSITIPDGVTCIEDLTFYGCSSLTSITIPDGVTSIGGGAFYGCEKLNTVINLSNLDIVAGSTDHGFVAYYADKVWTPGVYLSKEEMGMVIGEEFTLTATVIPEGEQVKWSTSNRTVAVVDNNGKVIAMGEGRAAITATAGDKSDMCLITVSKNEIPVNNISLNHTTTTIEEGEVLTLIATISPDDATDKTVTWSSSNTAVATVSNGVVIGVSKGVTAITANAGDKSATCVVTVEKRDIDVSEITLDQSTAVLIIGETMTLTATVLPDDATDKTIIWTTSDAAIATVMDGVVTPIADGTATITATAGNCTATCTITVQGWSFDEATGYLYINNDYDTNIGNSPWYSFNTKIKSVKLGPNVTYIGQHAFQDCRALESIDISESVTLIKYSAFRNCHALTNITIPSSVTEIEAFAFDGSALTSITIPATVTSIGNGICSGCSALTSVTLPEGIASIGIAWFNNCTSLSSITIPASVTSIEDTAFGGCAFSEINIPNGLISIEMQAFINCFNLTSITIPASVTNIGKNAFWGCYNLKTVINLSSLAIVAGETTHGYVAEHADKVWTPGVYLSEEEKGMVIGEQFILTATAIPVETTVTWNNSNTSVATIDENGVVTALAAGTTTLTATADEYSASCVVTVEAPRPLIESGEYYLYSVEEKKFLSRGEYWGTCATVDKYGIPFVWTAEEYSLKFLDSNVYLYETDDNNLYTDNTSTGFIFEEVEGGYLLKSQKSSRYLTIVDGAYTHQIVNVTDDANAATLWQPMTKAEHDAHVAGYVEENYANVIAAAGISATAGDFAGCLATLTAIDVTDAIGTARFSGNAGEWKFTEIRHQDWQPAYGTDFCELWQATGHYTQTITGLVAGIYKVTMQGFERAGGWATCNTLAEKGYEITTATLSANGEEVNLKSWYSDKSGDNTPNNTGEAVAKFGEGKYMNELYTYVGADGTLTLTVSKPSHVGDNWMLFNNFTLTHYTDEGATDVEKTTDNRQQSTVIYDLTGRRVEKATKGIYIVDGKRILVK